MPNNFEVGDVVQLVTDHPPMTVVKVGRNRIFCQWIDERGGLHEDYFYQNELRKP